MTAPNPAPTADQLVRPEVAAALLVLERMGLSPADLLSAPRDRATVPTFAEYVPVVAEAVTAGTRRAYGSPTGTGSSTTGAAAAWTSPHHRKLGS
jgi:hypothetical protein